MNDQRLLSLAETAFKAYNDAAGGKTWDGKDIPPFSEVGEKVQANWIAAVKAVVEHTEEETEEPSAQCPVKGCDASNNEDHECPQLNTAMRYVSRKLKA